jgi:nucleolar pre-ribosomal-associated protein 1
LKPDLVTLRNQWTIRQGESSPVSADDERLILAKNYLAQSPGANEVFKAWELFSKACQSLLWVNLRI